MSKRRQVLPITVEEQGLLGSGAVWWSTTHPFTPITGYRYQRVVGYDRSRQVRQIIEEDSAVLSVFTTTSWRALYQPEGQTVALAYCKPHLRPLLNREIGQIVVRPTKLSGATWQYLTRWYALN